MKNKGMILSTYVYMLLIFFLLLLGTMLAVLNNTKLLADKMKENAKDNPLINKDLVSLVLNGDDEMVIVKGDTFTDPGYIARTQSGKNLTAKVEGNVDTSKVGEYIITYTINYNQFSKAITRRVYVTELTAVHYITNLYNDDEARAKNGLKKDNTIDENIRYEGANPNNYVKFNDELWRVIGIFDNNVKIIRSESIGNLSRDSSISTINNGYGINEWSQATLKEYLNTMYYGGSTVTCYGGRNNATTTCPTASLNETAKSMIDNHIWNTAASSYISKTITTAESYSRERGTTTSATCTDADYCNDTITRTATWTGYVALPHVTDYVYASSESVCKTSMQSQDSDNNYICKNNNWMHYGSTTSDRMWTLSTSPIVYFCSAYVLYGDGHFYSLGSAFSLSVFPIVYLESNVKITGGSGTSTDPYILSN